MAKRKAPPRPGGASSRTSKARTSSKRTSKPARSSSTLDVHELARRFAQRWSRSYERSRGIAPKYRKRTVGLTDEQVHALEDIATDWGGYGGGRDWAEVLRIFVDACIEEVRRG